jgi:FkbM family methyltransferase
MGNQMPFRRESAWSNWQRIHLTLLLFGQLRKLTGEEGSVMIIEKLHTVGSRVRHSPFLARQQWFWSRIEPGWRHAFTALTENRGFLSHINGDLFRLDYEYASRYDRHDQRAYEPTFYPAFIQRITEGMTVLDVGAHVGFFTLGAAKRVGSGGRVYAFEASDQTARILRRHVIINGWQKVVEVVEAAVCDVVGTMQFYVDGASMANSLSRANVESLNLARLTAPQPITAMAIEVPAVTLDDFCRARRVTPDVIKIDVEGAEWQVLRGARRLLASRDVVILCEIHPAQMENCGASLADFSSFLRDVGYSISPIDEPNQAGIFHSLIARPK